MLTLQRLDIPRQRNVGAALSTLFSGPGAAKYDADVVAQAHAVLLATKALPTHGGLDIVVTDRATNRVVSAFYRTLVDLAVSLTDTLVPLEKAERAVLDDVQLVLKEAFPDEVRFIRFPYGLQWDALVKVREALATPAVAAAVTRLALDPSVAHLNRHIAVYGDTLGVTASGPDEGASKKWHDAYVLYAASVMIKYAKKPKTAETLLAAYEQQLEERKASLRKVRLRSAKKKSKKAAGTPTTP